MKRKILVVCISVVTFVLALGIMLYPLISTAYNEKHQAQVQVQYQQQVEQVDNSAIDKAWADAVAYNDAIKAGATPSDAFSHNAILWASTNYDELLNITGSGIMGYVRIPSIGVELPIFHGTSEQVLQRGAGHLLGTSLPVGGSSTHAVITAHSGMTSAKMFSDLDVLKDGDVFYLNILGETLVYQVDQIKTVLPHDTTYLGITQDADYCTLVTCTPFGINTHRLLVRGHRIPFESSSASEPEQPVASIDTAKSTWEEEYIKSLMVCGIIVILMVTVTILWYYIKEKRHSSKLRVR